MRFRNPIRLSIFAFGVILTPGIAWAEETVPTPGPGTSTVETMPKGVHRGTRSRAAVATKRKRVNLGEPPIDARMPPAGSAATGVTSSSPAGAPTTPYGGSD